MSDPKHLHEVDPRLNVDNRVLFLVVKSAKCLQIASIAKEYEKAWANDVSVAFHTTWAINYVNFKMADLGINSCLDLKLL